MGGSTRILLHQLSDPRIKHCPVLDKVNQAGKAIPDANNRKDGEQKH